MRAAFAKKSWRRETVVFSGVTDCYQPLEASYRLTRGCLEVCVERANPAAIITKSALVERDVDLLAELGRVAASHVTVSIPFWDAEKARAIEPYVPTPARRLRVIETLAKAGISVGVNVAPIIPGLNDQDIPRILAAARDAGARSAGHVLLRLPGPVKAVFEERLRAALPLTADRVLHRVRETRGGKLYDSRFGVRGRGEGTYAHAIHALFETTAARAGFKLGAIPSDVQLDEQETRASSGCMSMALPAPIAEVRPAPGRKVQLRDPVEDLCASSSPAASSDRADAELDRAGRRSAERVGFGSSSRRAPAASRSARGTTMAARQPESGRAARGRARGKWPPPRAGWPSRRP